MYPSLIQRQTSPRCPVLVNRFVSYEKEYQYNVHEMLSVQHFMCRTDSIEMPIA